MNNTNEALYTLDTQELFYAKKALISTIGDWMIILVLACTILSSFLMENHIFEFAPFLYIIFGSTIVSYLFRVRRKRYTRTVDIAFYTDRIEIHRVCVFTRLNKQREEFHTFTCTPLPKVSYNTRKCVITFEGKVHSDIYLYVPRSIEKRLGKSINHAGSCSFRLNDKNLDIVSIIEQHTPITVEIIG